MAVDRQMEILFAQVALDKGFVSEADLNRARKMTELLRDEGKEGKLGDTLVGSRLITREQALSVLKEVRARRGENPRIGGYELVEKVGEGGMGAVYRARQISMDREVALKLLPRRLSDDEKFVRRFLREARTCAQLNHPNIVRAIDVGESNGYHFFAMEFIEGEPLDERLDRDGALDEEEMIRIAVQACQGLEHAAGVGIVHRDIKPANIMLCPGGLVKIADMGLAVGAESDERQERMTDAGVAAGTPYYMAPEQVRGESDLDARTDMYALGATLFEALAGEKPFDGANPHAIMAKRLYEDPPEVHSFRACVSPVLSKVVSRMMARDREERYPGFAAVLDALRKAAEAPAAPAKPKPRPVRRRGSAAARGKKTGKKSKKNAPRPRRRTESAVMRHRDRTAQRREKARQARAGKIVFALGLCAAVGGFGWILSNAHNLRGPRHPNRQVRWTAPEDEQTRGEGARKLWESARNLHHRLDVAEEGTSEWRSLREETRKAYGKLVRYHGESAYAASASARLETLGGE